MGPSAWFVAACVLGAFAPAGDQTRIEWKLKEGDRFYVESVNTLKGSTTTAGEEVKSDLEISAVDSYKVLKRDKDGVVLEKTILSRRFKSSSAELDKAGEALAKKLEGNVLKIFFDPTMQKVTRIEGMRDYMRRFGDESADSSKHEESIKEEQRNIFAGYLPDMPVKPGQRWQQMTEHSSLDPTANYKAVEDYTYKGQETVGGKPVELIEAAMTITFLPPKRAGLEIKEDLNADTARASYYVDAAAGRLVKSTRTFHVKGKLTMSVAGKDAASQVDQEQSWRIRLTDERP